MSKKWNILALFIFSLQSLAQTGDPVRFIGTDSNWFEPTNWDNGMIPDGSTDVILSSGQHVIINQNLSPTTTIIVNNITLQDATLSTLANTVVEYNNLFIIGQSLFDTQSSNVQGNELSLSADTSAESGWGLKLNPTTNDTRSVKITANTTHIQMYLGGIFAASLGNIGMGHYATLSTDDIELDGFLEIDTIYDFLPRVGDTFQIITDRNSLAGQFKNMNEGDVVARLNDLSIVIT
ncbi:MAG: hypothetical protein AB8B80_10595 [Marinicellaceae bacterium]